MRNVVFVTHNIVKFYRSVTLTASLQNEIMTYLHFSELNLLQRQYHLLYIMLLLIVMLNFYKTMQFFNDFEKIGKHFVQEIYILNHYNN